jgi:hypothetical protein
MTYDVFQYALVALIVVAAVALTVRAMVRAARNKRTALTACGSCKLKDVCQKPEKNSAKKCAEKVAQVEKSQ